MAGDNNGDGEVGGGRQIQILPDLVEAMTQMFTNALQTSIATITASNATNGNGADSTTQSSQPKPPPFSCKEYSISDEMTVAEYLKRFEWSVQSSKIPKEKYADYARVYMGLELNNALKLLVNPREPEQLAYKEMCTILIAHFDSAKNKYAGSVKLRQIKQREKETIASFTLRLRQGAAHCEYGDFLDRMLIEQLLHGLDDRNMCDEIIAKKPETFEAAYEIANSLEATRRTADEMKNNDNS
ncbi:hypothetical protein QAD02_002458 [Eretmocerus hayati]|uniref:Uncharacterized protein n=1 Tax=Eretmocerus hayati TaxID=131215 RepID=A0ACC2NIX8_9HYME|nr:hypothetical protein QAD02_002458 [Eretmocerus hayati]